MTVYDLEKQATPGPLTSQGCTILAKTGWVGDRDPWTLGASEEFHMASTDENHRGHDEQEANARLIAHCRNHFMQALEALKLAEKTLMSMCGPEVYQATHRSWPIGQVREAIKELEEVKA